MSNLIKPNFQGGLPIAPQGPGAAPVQPDPQPFDARRLWLVIFKHRWLIALAVLCTMIPTAIYVQLAEPLYRATATIQVDPESAKILPYKDISDSLANPLPHFELYMKTQDELLRSNTLVSRVAKRILKNFREISMSTLPQPLNDGLQVQRVEGSQMLRISYTARDPRLAAVLANVWAEEFIQLHAEARNQTGEKATGFLQKQLLALKVKVEKAEADLVEYARRHEILNIDSKQENVIRQRFGYLNGEVSRAEKDFIGRKAEYERLRGVSAQDFPESLKSQAITALETLSFQTEQELSKLLSQFDEKWPAVVQKKQELTLVNDQLRGAKNATLARATKEAEMKYGAARNEYNMLLTALKVQAGMVSRLNQASVEYNTLRRELEASEQLYAGLLQRLKEAGVSAGLELGNIHISDRAQANSTPYRPRKTLSLSMALALGLLMGLGISFVRESVDRTLGDPWDVERLGLPLLGWMPKADGAAMRSGLGCGESLLKTVAITPLSSGDALGASKLTESQHRTRESFRTLCASLLLSRPESPPRTVLITSAVPKEGKSTTALFLGATLAEMGSPTLLIDADFRNPSLGRMLGVNGTEGLSTYLAGGKLVIKQTDKPNLYFLSAGAVPPNPVALLSAPRIREALDRLIEQFRFILIDSPPVLSVADASILASKVEGVVLVIHAGLTPKEIVNKAFIQLQRIGCYILGAAVNQVDLKNPEYSYYQKYYYDQQGSQQKTS